MKKIKFFIKLSLLFTVCLYIFYLFLPLFLVELIYSSNKEIASFPISIDKISFSPTTSYINMENIIVKNRKFYSKPQLLKIGSLSIKIDFTTLFSKNLIVDDFSLSRVYITVEDKNGNINLYDFENRLSKNTHQNNKTSKKNIIIKKLSIYNIKVSILSKIFNRKKDNIKIPDINLKNIVKSSNGMTINTLSSQLMVILIKNVKNSVLNNKHMIKKIERKVLNQVKKGLIKKLLKF